MLLYSNIFLGFLLQWTSDHVAFWNHNCKQPLRGQACYRQLHRHRALKKKRHEAALFAFLVQLIIGHSCNHHCFWLKASLPWQSLTIFSRQLIWKLDNILKTAHLKQFRNILTTMPRYRASSSAIFTFCDLPSLWPARNRPQFLQPLWFRLMSLIWKWGTMKKFSPLLCKSLPPQ